MGYEFEDDGTETLGIKTTDDFDVRVTWLDGNSVTNRQGIVWRCITATIEDETDEIYRVDLKIEDRYHHTSIVGDASKIPEKGEWDSFPIK